MEKKDSYIKLKKIASLINSQYQKQVQNLKKNKIPIKKEDIEGLHLKIQKEIEQMDEPDSIGNQMAIEINDLTRNYCLKILPEKTSSLKHKKKYFDQINTDYKSKVDELINDYLINKYIDFI